MNSSLNSVNFLRILARYDAKIAKICNLWTFWPVIQLICHLLEIQKKMGYYLNVQKLNIFAIFASYLASALNVFLVLSTNITVLLGPSHMFTIVMLTSRCFFNI